MLAVSRGDVHERPGPAQAPDEPGGVCAGVAVTKAVEVPVKAIDALALGVGDGNTEVLSGGAVVPWAMCTATQASSTRSAAHHSIAVKSVHRFWQVGIIVLKIPRGC